MRRKLPLYFFWQVVLQYGIFFDELVITILDPKSYTTLHMLFMPYTILYIGFTHSLVLASDSSLRKTIKVILNGMKPVGLYRLCFDKWQ